MKFGKEIQSQQIPGWSQYYLDYKALKKIISAANKSILETPSPFLDGMRPSDVLLSTTPAALPVSPASFSVDAALRTDVMEPLAIPIVGRDEDRGPEFQRSKALFFFKLERELEKINQFYLEREAELKFRLNTLLSKRRAAKQRSAANLDGSLETFGAEWRAVQEGFRSLDKDLSKLQQFIELNATGFRKILKKWDKRSKSRTKELYLARQVEVQPCFNRELIGELSDTVAACLLDPENGGPDGTNEGFQPADVLQQQIALEGNADQGRSFRDFERNLLQAAHANDENAVTELLSFADVSLANHDVDRPGVMRILWRVALSAPIAIADLILASQPFDLQYVDDINGRTSLHEAALAGELRLVARCLRDNISVNRQDVYGRSALHYAAIQGYDAVAQHLLTAGADPNVIDMDNHTPLIYAVVNGHLGCVRILVDSGHVGVGAPLTTSNLLPLSLACQHGHPAIVVFLLERGAVSVPNTNGEYPIHLAAREGHASVCRLLVSRPGGEEYKDVPDKYNEWTPLFHAARHGFDECVQVLLDASVNPHAIDELGKTAVYYSSWHGHIKCTNKLLTAMATYTPARIPLSRSMIPPGASGARGAITTSMSSRSPHSDLNVSPFDQASFGVAGSDDADMDLDMIPSLSLPPPIMPFRIYGHNYLDKNYLLQITLGSSTHDPKRGQSSSPLDNASPVELLEKVLRRSDFTHQSGSGALRRSGPAVKIVMTLRPNEADALADNALMSSHSTTLPLPEDGEVFSFQTRNLDDITLEFSFYPIFGSKAIGRAVASPQTLRDIRSQYVRTIPVLDHRLHVIGKVTFSSLIITPFSEVALEIGGAVETYWKSTAVPSLEALSSTQQAGESYFTTPSTGTAEAGPLSSSRATTTFASQSDAHTPPLSLNGGTHSNVNAAAANIVTLSSLSGEFVHIVVQVTRDMRTVIYPDWNLPVDDGMFDIGVADVSLLQFEKLAEKSGRLLNEGDVASLTNAVAWHRYLAQRMATLEDVLKILPVTFGVSLELRYPNPVVRERYNLGRHHEPNAFVDAVLGAVYSVSRSLAHEAPRRKVVFSSFVPAICTTINWKQPNYAVFFSSKCGVAKGTTLLPLGQSLPPDEEESDNRCRSIGAAVQFAKINNLLGVILNASLLGVIPSLVQGAKEHGVVLAAFGSAAQLTGLQTALNGSSPDAPKIDATLSDGVLSYIDHVLAPPL